MDGRCKIVEFEEILIRAKQGEQTAIQQIIETYRPMLIHNSLINGRYDEDLYQELVAEVMKCIFYFR